MQRLTNPPVYIRLFGSFEIDRNGSAIPYDEWKRRQTQMLLKFLAYHRGRVVSQDELLEVLYPDHPDPNTTRRNFLGRVSDLRRILEPSLERGPKSAYIVRVGTGLYTLPKDAPCRIDIQEFRDQLELADRFVQSQDWTQAIPYLEEAIRLYRGHLLEDDPYEEWVQLPRETLKNEFGRALDQAARGYVELGSFWAAVRAADRLIHLDPYHENAYRTKMVALQGAGEPQGFASVYHACTRALRELGVEPSEETTDLFEELTAKPSSPSISFSSTPTHGAETTKHRKRPTGSIVGRQTEQRHLSTLLADGIHRCVTILGPGGIGKTSLALDVGRRQKALYPDGVHFVTVPNDTTPDALLARFAEALGFNLDMSVNLVDQIIDALHHRRTLFIVDNAETGIESVAVIDKIVSECPMIQVLATSRERLHLEHEWIVELTGLTTPGDTASIHSMNELLAYDAPRLFVTRLRQGDSQIQLNLEEMAAVVDVCRLVEGLPLAIELAAVWGRILSIQEIADELRKGLDRLRPEGSRIGHSSIRTVFEQSWRYLTRDEQRSFLGLTIFKEGFTRESAQAVSGATPSTLLGLRDKSFIKRVNAGRYSIHEVLRHFGEEKLLQGESLANRVRDAHARYFAGLSEEWSDHLSSERQVDALRRMRLEHANIRAAWNWSLSRDDIDLLDRMADAVLKYYLLQNRWNEYLRLVEAALESPGLRTPQEGVKTSSSNGKPAGQRLRGLQARLKLGLGLGHYNLSEYDSAERGLEEAVHLAEGVGDTDTTARSLGYLSRIDSTRGKNDTALKKVERAVELHRRAQNHEGLGLSLGHMGAIKLHMGEFESARDITAESLRYHREYGNLQQIAGALINLGGIVGNLKEYTDAEKYLKESLDTGRRLDDRKIQFIALGNLGFLAYLRKRHHIAETYCKEALSFARSLGHRHGEANTLQYLGLIASDLGEDHRAQDLLMQALHIARSTGTSLITVQVVVGLAQLIAKHGNPEFAVALLRAVHAHPAATGATKQNAKRAFQRLEANLDEEAVQRAHQKAAIPWSTLVDELMSVIPPPATTHS